MQSLLPPTSPCASACLTRPCARPWLPWFMMGSPLRNSFVHLGGARARFIGSSVNTMPNCAAHKKLLKKLRENDAKMAEAQRLNLVPVKPSFVIVTETGALMKHMDKILASGAEVFIPQFCVTKELVKLSRHNNLAEEALEEIMSNPSIFHKICQLNEEVFTVIPEGMKTRVTGIISLMCEMWTNNLKVKLFTTSQDVYEMALKQGLGSDVEVVLLEN